MSDDAYSSFLDQANKDTGSKKVSTSSQGQKNPSKAVNTDVPPSLHSVRAVYTSDADEPFEPVSLQWDEKTIPDANSFGKLLGHSGSVSKIANKDFDPRGQYAEVLEIVEKIGDGKSTVFKVQQGHTRAEYYVVSLDGGHKRLVGLKALAVES